MKTFVIAAVTLVLTLGCQKQSEGPVTETQPQPPPVAAAPTGDVQTFDLKISGDAYEPAAITVRDGVPLRLNVTRDDKPTCGDVLSIPSQNISRPIPVNQVTTIEFTPHKAGDLEFTCGMNMMRGRIVVQPSGV